MPPVTVDAGSIVGGGSGNTGWNARSTFLLNQPDQQQRSHSGAVQPVGNATANTRVAQSFTAGSSYSLAAVLLYVYKTGAPTDNWYVEIQSDSSNTPSGSVLATSQNLSGEYTFADLGHLVRYDFASPPSLTNGTKYWIVYQRSTAVNASNYINLVIGSTSLYAGGGLSIHNGTSWGAESGTVDASFVTLKTTKSVYQVVQDTTPRLRVYKSTDDGASFSEQDNANAPTPNSATKPFSASHRWGGRNQLVGDGCNPYIYVGYFSNTNTGRIRRFNPLSDTWTTDLGGADVSTDVDFNRNIRVSQSDWEIGFHYTSLADDADVEHVLYNGAMGAQVQLGAINSTEASAYLDVTQERRATTSTPSTARYLTAWYQDCNADDVLVRTIFDATLGTATALDATAADVETEHISGVYREIEDGASDKVLVAFIDADGTLEERYCTVGVTSASITLGTQHEVSASTSYLGRSVATCRFGNNLYIFACTGSQIDYFVDIGTTGVWTPIYTWISGLTNAVVSTAEPLSGTGIFVSYVDNGDTKVNLLKPFGFPFPLRSTRNNTLLRM
jgi:hypothetical protein